MPRILRPVFSIPLLYNQSLFGYIRRMGPTYGGIFFDEAHSVQQTGDGGYLVAGWTRSSGAGDADFLVLKLRSDGTVEWQKTYGGDSWDEARSIRQTSEGGYIVAGWTMS